MKDREKDTWGVLQDKASDQKRVGNIIAPADWESLMKLRIDEIMDRSGEMIIQGTDGSPDKVMRFFHATLAAEKALFADEIDKWEMLNILWAGSSYWNYGVAGFSLLDDRLELILCREYGTDVHTGEEEHTLPDGMLSFLSESYRTYCRSKRSNSFAGVRESTSWTRLESKEDVISTCFKIHQLSVSQGYVKNIRDFMWSSYLTYHGSYSWSFLHLAPILGCFSSRMRDALRAFEKREKNWMCRKDGHEL